MKKQRSKVKIRFKAYFVAIGATTCFLAILFILFDFNNSVESVTKDAKAEIVSSLYFVPSPKEEPLVEERYLRNDFDDPTIFFVPHKYGFLKAIDQQSQLELINMPPLSFTFLPIKESKAIRELNVPEQPKIQDWPLPPTSLVKKKTLVIPENKNLVFSKGMSFDLPLDLSRMASVDSVAIFKVNLNESLVFQSQSSGNREIDQLLQKKLYLHCFQKQYFKEISKTQFYKVIIDLRKK